MTTTTLAPAATLSSLDRCDRCGAQAYVRVTMSTGGELLFCAHHARKYDEPLRKVASDIHDEADKLHATPATAPDGER